jgi:DNA-binding NtrC family response regulator
MERLEQVAIQQALRLSEGNRTKAASLLGISRDTLYRKLRQAKAEG